jgi:hypothetical protein
MLHHMAAVVHCQSFTAQGAHSNTLQEACPAVLLCTALSSNAFRAILCFEGGSMTPAAMRAGAKCTQACFTTHLALRTRLTGGSEAPHRCGCLSMFVYIHACKDKAVKT